MKKTIIFGLVFLILISSVSAATILDYYNTNDDGATGFFGTEWTAQTFNATYSYNLTSIKLKLYRVGNVENITVAIRNTVASSPGTVNLVSTEYNFTTITTNTAGEWIEFTFVDELNITKNQVYAIVVEAGIDGSNRPYWRRDSTSPTYTTGSDFYSTDSGTTWVIQSGVDLMFETYSLNPPFTSIDINFYDEETGLLLDENQTIQYYLLGQSFTNYTNVTLINNTNDVLTLLVPDTYNIYYKATDYKANKYYINIEDNQSYNINLYNLLDNATNTELRLTINNGIEVLPNIIVAKQRLYPGEGLWRTVEMDKSGEDGLTLFNIIEKDVEYRFMFKNYDNSLIRTSDTWHFSCDSFICTRTAIVDNSTLIQQIGELNVYYNITEGLENFSITWNEPNGYNIEVLTKISKFMPSYSLLICDDTQTGSSAVVYCNVSQYTGDLIVNFYIDGISKQSLVPRLTYDLLPQLLGEQEGSFYSLVIGLTIIMMGLYSAMGAIIFTMAAFILLTLLQFSSPFNLIVVITALVIGITLAALIKK